MDQPYTKLDKFHAALLMSERSLFLLLQGVAVLAIESIYFFSIGWPISHFALGDSWSFGRTHLLYIWCTGLILGLPITLALFVGAPIVASVWPRYLRLAKERRQTCHSNQLN